MERQIYEMSFATESICFVYHFTATNHQILTNIMSPCGIGSLANTD